MSAEFDSVLSRIQAWRIYVQSSGRFVQVAKAELEMLHLFEWVRDFMEKLLPHAERVSLQNVFGGDCVRIAMLRAMLESVHFSEFRAADQRLQTCFEKCEAVEKILEDLNLGGTLRLAQLEARRCMATPYATPYAKEIDVPPSVELASEDEDESIFCSITDWGEQQYSEESTDSEYGGSDSNSDGYWEATSRKTKLDFFTRQPVLEASVPWREKAHEKYFQAMMKRVNNTTWLNREIAKMIELERYCKDNYLVPVLVDELLPSVDAMYVRRFLTKKQNDIYIINGDKLTTLPVEKLRDCIGRGQAKKKTKELSGQERKELKRTIREGGERLRKYVQSSDPMANQQDRLEEKLEVLDKRLESAGEIEASVLRKMMDVLTENALALDAVESLRRAEVLKAVHKIGALEKIYISPTDQKLRDVRISNNTTEVPQIPDQVFKEAYTFEGWVEGSAPRQQGDLLDDTVRECDLEFLIETTRGAIEELGKEKSFQSERLEEANKAMEDVEWKFELAKQDGSLEVEKELDKEMIMRLNFTGTPAKAGRESLVTTRRKAISQVEAAKDVLKWQADAIRNLDEELVSLKARKDRISVKARHSQSILDSQAIQKFFKDGKPLTPHWTLEQRSAPVIDVQGFQDERVAPGSFCFHNDYTGYSEREYREDPDELHRGDGSAAVREARKDCRVSFESIHAQLHNDCVNAIEVALEDKNWRVHKERRTLPHLFVESAFLDISMKLKKPDFVKKKQDKFKRQFDDQGKAAKQWIEKPEEWMWPVSKGMVIIESFRKHCRCDDELYAACLELRRIVEEREESKAFTNPKLWSGDAFVVKEAICLRKMVVRCNNVRQDLVTKLDAEFEQASNPFTTAIANARRTGGFLPAALFESESSARIIEDLAEAFILTSKAPSLTQSLLCEACFEELDASFLGDHFCESVPADGYKCYGYNGEGCKAPEERDCLFPWPQAGYVWTIFGIRHLVKLDTTMPWSVSEREELNLDTMLVWSDAEPKELDEHAIMLKDRTVTKRAGQLLQKLKLWEDLKEVKAVIAKAFPSMVTNVELDLKLVKVPKGEVVFIIDEREESAEKKVRWMDVEGWVPCVVNGATVFRPKAEWRVDPMLDNREVTWQEMRRGLADQQLSESQLLAHWNNLKPAQADIEAEIDDEIDKLVKWKNWREEIKQAVKLEQSSTKAKEMSRMDMRIAAGVDKWSVCQSNLNLKFLLLQPIKHPTVSSRI